MFNLQTSMNKNLRTSPNCPRKTMEHKYHKS